MTTPQKTPLALSSEELDDFRLTEEPLDSSGVVLTATGELDIATAPVIRERLNALIADGARRLVLDMRPVSFMDSVALAAILHGRSQLGDRGRMAIVIARDSYPRLVFEIAGLPPSLDLFETREAAIAHVRS